MNKWVFTQGGVLAGNRQDRVDSVAQRLTSVCTGRRISVQVLATDAVTAFSWPDGHLFVSRGLVDGLDDPELAAAIAHELGHLLSDGRMQTIASLHGCCTDPDREVRADAAGIELLRAQGLPPSAMVTMLEKVSTCGSLPPQCRLALEHRIALLTARISSEVNAPMPKSP